MLWLHHRRAEDDGGMAEAIWDSYGRDAIYGSLLDCGLRDLGRGGSGSVSGECTRDQKSAGTEDGRAGEPVVDEAAHVRLIAEFVPPVAGDPYSADVLAAAPRPGAEYRSPHSAHAEGAAQMNIQLANVISDISGVTGQAILKAILDGERDPRELAGYRDCRVEAGEEEIAQALEGNWQEEQLFVLRQEQAGYEFCQKQITECDQQLAQYLARREDQTQGATLPEETRKGRRKKKKGNPQFNLREELFRMTGGPDPDRWHRCHDGD